MHLKVMVWVSSSREGPEAASASEPASGSCSDSDCKYGLTSPSPLQYVLIDS